MTPLSPFAAARDDPGRPALNTYPEQRFPPASVRRLGHLLGLGQQVQHELAEVVVARPEPRQDVCASAPQAAPQGPIVPGDAGEAPGAGADRPDQDAADQDLLQDLARRLKPLRQGVIGGGPDEAAALPAPMAASRTPDPLHHVHDQGQLNRDVIKVELDRASEDGAPGARPRRRRVEHAGRPVHPHAGDRGGQEQVDVPHEAQRPVRAGARLDHNVAGDRGGWGTASTMLYRGRSAGAASTTRSVLAIGGAWWHRRYRFYLLPESH
jgi:hypothetical protein